jgi:GTPase SAR1 family protein
LEKRKVSYEEGMKLANELGIDFIETSALNNTNIQSVFENLTRKCFFETKKIIKNKKKTGIFSSLSNEDDVDIKLSKN